ncbi:MAG TPA: biotin/lipoyl-containing protein, partial [Solirubrobacterales bacterium]|nr:biotin/lipoyl-containing protein [Solirubrobacterales bacterium]
MAEIVMPRLSDSMEEGTILTWMKQVGDEVAVGDELVEIETDKANMAYESDVAGTLTQIMAQEGETLAIGVPIAVVGDPGEAPTQMDGGESGEAPTVVEEAPTQVDEAVREEPVPASQPTAPAAPAAEGERVKASPLARRIARDKGMDLSTLKGSGPGGRIVKADVESAQVGAAASASARADVPAASAPAPAGRGGGCGGDSERCRGDGEGDDHLPGADSSPTGGGAADVGVEGDRAPLL